MTLGVNKSNPKILRFVLGVSLKILKKVRFMPGAAKVFCLRPRSGYYYGIFAFARLSVLAAYWRQATLPIGARHNPILFKILRKLKENFHNFGVSLTHKPNDANFSSSII